MTHPIHFQRLGALLCAVMLTSLVVTLSGVMQRFVPWWNPYYLVGTCFLVALEAAFVQFTIRRERMWFSEGARYLVAEIAALVVIMRVVATLGVGLTTLRADAQHWLASPLSAVTDGSFCACMLLGVFVALTARSSARDLQELAPQEFEHIESTDEASFSRAVTSRERAEALLGVNRRFVVGGVILLVALSIQVVNITRFGGASLPLSPVVGGAALAYVICGFLLYSQARLALLQSRWRLEHINVDASVIRRWTRSSVLLIGALALVMLALPRTYGLGLLDTLRTALGFVGMLLAELGYLVLWLLSMLALIPMLLLAWLTSGSTSAVPPPPPPPLPPAMPPTTPGTPPLLPSLVFWGCMIFLAGYAIMIVLQRHPGLLKALTLRGPLAVLARWFGLTWRDTTGWMREAATSIGKRLQRSPATAPKQRWPALRLARLAPRELVRYFYHSTLERAARRGMGRNRSETPYEYSAAMARRLPEAQDDIAALTNTFVAAEYGPHAPMPEHARGARRHWDRLRRYLRQRADG